MGAPKLEREKARKPSGSRKESALRIYGCTREAALVLNDGRFLTDEKSKAYAYAVQRHNAELRSVGWEITFAEWLDVWLSSGYWALRGKERGRYSMARYGDVGPYKVGNVSIQLSSQNTGEALSRRRKKSSWCNTSLAGAGRGWVINPKYTKRPYVAKFRKKYLGAFATPEEAVAARDAARDAFFAALPPSP